MFIPFDFNRDGKVSTGEFAVGMSMMESFEAKGQGDELREELAAEGLDLDELEFMDEWERRQALEDAGLDPDDYDIF